MMAQQQNEKETFKVPETWALCFRKECPRKKECLRFNVANSMTEMPETGPAVYPTVAMGKQGCHLFVSNEPEKMAWGFNTLFADVKSKDEKELRSAVKIFLGGHAAYYRYHNGKRLLTIKQQEWIINLFREKGYTEDLAFDNYKTAYNFEP